MSPEAQRLAIAEVCGWTYVRSVVDRNPDNDRMAYLAGSLRNNKRDEWEVPDYLYDLNAMHEAEKILENPKENGRLMATYSVWKLTEVCNAYTKGHEKSRAGSTVTYWLIHATAAQRAEAFLRTLGKWEDTQP